MTTTFTLNPDQLSAITAILAWKADPTAGPFFVFKGFAGTGKTFSIKSLLMEKKLGRMCFTAPTNKATKVLREMLTTPDYKPECATIYSLLGLRLEANGEVREIAKRAVDEESLDLSAYSVVVVDEGSMVNKMLMGYMKEAADRFKVKFLLMGDSAQLPPVGEQTSPIWLLKAPGAELTKVMRYDNTILDLATRIRNVVDHPAPNVKIESANDGEEGVWKMGATEFEKSLTERAQEFAVPGQAKLIAWRNLTVHKYNGLIRNALFGEAAARWLPGDRLILTAPANDLEDSKIGNTDDEGEVTRAAINWHPLHEHIKVWNLTVAIDGGRVIEVRSLHSSSQLEYDQEVEKRAGAARRDGRLWGLFWKFKEQFHEVRHGYAITAHRSQGSTYRSTWVDWRDILINRNRQEAFRCLYVACTRAQKQLILN